MSEFEKMLVKSLLSFIMNTYTREEIKNFSSLTKQYMYLSFYPYSYDDLNEYMFVSFCQNNDEIEFNNHIAVLKNTSDVVFDGNCRLAPLMSKHHIIKIEDIKKYFSGFEIEDLNIQETLYNLPTIEQYRFDILYKPVLSYVYKTNNPELHEDDIEILKKYFSTCTNIKLNVIHKYSSTKNIDDITNVVVEYNSKKIGIISVHPLSDFWSKTYTTDRYQWVNMLNEIEKATDLGFMRIYGVDKVVDKSCDASTIVQIPGKSSIAVHLKNPWKDED